MKSDEQNNAIAGISNDFLPSLSTNIATNGCVEKLLNCGIVKSIPTYPGFNKNFSEASIGKSKNSAEPRVKKTDI